MNSNHPHNPTAPKHPLLPLGSPAMFPFDEKMMMIAQASSSPSSSSLSRPHRHHRASKSSLYSLPNWTRLGEPTNNNSENNDLNNEASSAVLANDSEADNATAPSPNYNGTSTSAIINAANTTNSSGLAPTYSTPREASSAYRSGLLKSDFHISSNHPSIRLAFRHLLVRNEEEGNDAKLLGTGKVEGDGNSEHSVGDNKSDDMEEGAAASNNLVDDEKKGCKNKEDEEDSKTLYLCWVRQDGIPCHFRPMHPSTIIRRHSPATTEARAEGGRVTNHLRGSQARDRETNEQQTDATCDNMLVNENDHIENTFPGHAFVFCRRVEYSHSYTDRDATNNKNNDDEDGSQHSNNGEDDPIVVNDDSDGKTYFLRRKRRRRGSTDSQNSNKEEIDAPNNESDGWESFLVVGGYRPGVMPADISESNVGGNTEVEEGKREEGSDGDESNGSSDDDSNDDRELQVQLVTITQSITNAAKNDNSASPMSGARAEGTVDDDDNDNDDLPSKVLGCSDCTQSVPFLRGAMNPKPRHTPAFVATAINNDNNARSSPQLELPSRPSTLSEEQYHCPSFKVTVCTTRLDPTPIDTSSKHYDELILGGWPCRCEPGCFPSSMDIPENGRNLLRSRFEADLQAASDSLPPVARDKLKVSTPVWINKSQKFGPKAAPITGRDGCFHPGASWLVKNGMSPLKCGGVEWYDAKHYLSDCDLWGQGGLMLHELSHAWHCLHVEDGYDNAEIKEVWERAMEEGLYECVRVHGSQGPECRAYACQDQMEYFAELSVAFLGGLDPNREHNKWYPFNRAQVREHDPRAFDMLCRVWGVDIQNEDDRSSQDVEGNDTAHAHRHADSSGEGSKES